MKNVDKICPNEDVIDIFVSTLEKQLYRCTGYGKESDMFVSVNGRGTVTETNPRGILWGPPLTRDIVLCQGQAPVMFPASRVSI